MIKSIYINGRSFWKGTDFEKVHVTCPTGEEPY